MRQRHLGWWSGGVLAAVVAMAGILTSAPQARQTPISDQPDNPYKLATFEAAGKIRLGLVLGSRVLDIEAANQPLMTRAKLARVAIPTEMKALIEQYATVSPRLYQIANYFKTNSTANLSFAFDYDAVSFKAPIKYPWNLIAAAANDKAHAEGMGGGNAGGPPPPAAPPASPPAGGAQGAPGGRPAGGGGFDPTAASRIVPGRDAPIMFAKSPRSCIIDPGEPFYIVDGRQRTDYEVELAIVMGPRPAYRIPREQAHDYVFGYSLAQDLTDRGSERLREVSMFPGVNWFDGKSVDRAAPFGPVIVPKEFMPNAYNLKISAKLNGKTVQEANTSELIWDESHLVGYLASRLTLYPVDVILTGTPAGTGAERQTFIKPGDVMTVEIEGIGTLTTPFKALSEKPALPSGQ